ncbi:NAD(P)/FAD-dependent oxidoreductase [Aurantivibrio plasticivorans]
MHAEKPSSPTTIAPEEVDVVIVGGGLSGIGAAVHLQQQCPGKRYVLLESRDALGGTWDLFRYPGIRSDSDMHTLGFSFNPWPDAKAIADGPAIKRYINDTADKFSVTPHIRLSHRVTQAFWSDETQRWTITVQHGGNTLQFIAQFLFMGSGYYNYNAGHNPLFPNESDFKGEIIHPQFWPEELDYRDKNMVIIGSGATAVTLVPTLAKTAKHVTMLQRSPTYIVARPGKDRIANLLKSLLSDTLAYKITRKKNIWLSRFFNSRIQKNPGKAKKFLLKLTRKELPEGIDIKHFTPDYMPWDQRICLAPDGDFFSALRNGSASIVTGDIESFSSSGITLKSGHTLEADIIVKATGLELVTGGHVDIRVNNEPIHFGETVSYKGVMFSGVPNFVLVFGYTMASWTLKADLAALYFCRMINHLDRTGYSMACPPRPPQDLQIKPLLSFNSGYVQRAEAKLPKQGDRPPWVVHQDYLADRQVLLNEEIPDGVMVFK